LRRFFSGEIMASPLQLKLTDLFSTWPSTFQRHMFGADCYMAGDKLFAWAQADQICLTKLPLPQRDEILDTMKATPHIHGGRILTSNWRMVTINTPAKWKKVLPYLRLSYETALAASIADAGKPKKPRSRKKMVMR
jgi:hypothetical protein